MNGEDVPAPPPGFVYKDEGIPSPPPGFVLKDDSPPPPPPGFEYPQSFGEVASRAAQRGYHGMTQIPSSLGMAAVGRNLGQLYELEQIAAGGGDIRNIPPERDIMNARFLNPQQRQELRANLEAEGARATQDIVEKQQRIAAVGPRPASVEAAMKPEEWTSKDFAGFWEAFKKAPAQTITTVGLESLPAQVPSMLAAIPAGMAMGPAGAIGAIGTGSAITDYASKIREAMTDAGVDWKDPDMVAAALADPETMETIRRKAMMHAVPVALLDAASMKIAGQVLAPGLKSYPKTQHVANVAAQLPVQGALGAGGEVLGSFAAGETPKLGETLAEAYGEAMTTLPEMAIAALSRGKVKPGRGGGVETVPVATEAEAHAATVAPIPTEAGIVLPGPPEMVAPTAVTPGAVDVSGAKRSGATISPTATEAAVEMGKTTPIAEPPPEAAIPAAEIPGLYKGTFSPVEVQTMLTRNTQQLINYNIALADPEVERFPEKMARLQAQLPILKAEILAQRTFLAQNAVPAPRVLLPPPSITPAEAAAGLEPPPNPMSTLPVVVNVPEEVNVAAAKIEILPPEPRPQAPLDVVLGRPLDLSNEQVKVAAGNFGLLRYALGDVEAGDVYITGAFNISPGQKPTGVRLMVSQDEISPKNVIVHSNTAVNPVGGPLTPNGPRVDIVEAATAKFGQRFHNYVFGLGEQFRVLRDVMAGLPPLINAERYPGVPTDFADILSYGVGVSFDKRYHGVNIKVPINAAFINVGALKHADPTKAATGLFHTMIHELSHHVHRTEARMEDVIAEVIGHLQEISTFNTNDFIQGLRNTITQHHDVAMWMRGLYQDGYVESIGRPLPVGEGSRRPSIGNVRDATDRAWGGWGSTLSDWAKVGASGSGRVRDSGRGGATLTDVGGYAGRADYGLGANQRAVNAEVGHRYGTATQQTAETQGARQALNVVYKGDMPEEVAAAAAHADHISWLYKWGGGLLDLTQRNLRFTPLIKYTEGARLWHMLESMIQDAMATVAKRWRALGKVQSDALAQFFDDLVHMTYLTARERAAGVVRQPNPAEQALMINRLGLSRQALGVYTDVKNFFTTFLGLTAQSARENARRTITDPTALLKALDEIDSWVATLEKRPYFPFLRFGSHYIHAKDARGNTVFFGLYERKGVLTAKQVRDNMVEQVRRQFPGADIDIGVMPEDVRPFMGLPPSLLKHIRTKMSLTPSQMAALEQLTHEMSPEMSFRHRFEHKSYTPGYSRDFIRAFSHYAFHGARYYAKTKYMWMMEEQIDAARKVGGDKATRIANFMEDHLNKTMIDAKGDHGLLKGIAFNWHLAFMPSSAFVNTTQTPMVTLPFLAAKFGNTRAVREMTNAMRQLNSFYRKGEYKGLTEFDMQAIGIGIRWGAVSETQASELAALGNGNRLIEGVGGTELQRFMSWFQQKGALLFETAEQFNRRIAYRAALNLAMKDPTNRYTNEAVMKNPTMYSDLQNGVNTGGLRFTEQQARAIVTAIDTVEQTQFVYSRFARPRFMRHPIAGAVTVFMRYQQGILFLLLNEGRGYRWRYLMIAAALGGLSGLMGYDELKDLFEGSAKRMGYNMNVDAEIRKYVRQLTGSASAADYVLHGWARRGFNFAHILDALGSFATGRPGRGFLSMEPGQNVGAPVLDFSKMIAPRMLPIEVGKLISPYQDPKKVLFEQSQKASGAVFSVGVNIAKALMNYKQEGTDVKRWENAVPRIIGSISKATRTYSEGRERFGGAAPSSSRTFLKYDVRDTEQLAEIIFQGMGFNTLRQSTEWDFTRAKLEHKQFIEGSRKVLLEQLFETIQDKDPEAKQHVINDIRKFNEMVKGTEDRGYAITSENAQQSLRSRMREFQAGEAGLSTKKREIPVIREMRELYPNMGVVDVQRR